MKTFITINGETAFATERPSLAKAQQSAENICDHSKEIIVREVTDFTDYTAPIIEIPTYHGRMQDFFRVALTRYSNNPIAEAIGVELLEHLSLLENS